MFDGKSILITGGTGSFGQSCARAILSRFSPARVIIFSRDEYKQFLMAQELNGTALRYFIGDVRDYARLEQAFNGVDIVIHAAALKHVPIAEYNPLECVKTNINGAENVIQAALARGVEHVIALSTDKAALPVNLYGATKLVSDKLFVAANNLVGNGKTLFSVVRYGNVVNSRGSVISLFQKIRASGVSEFPITDLRMTRFWITLPQGVDFVLSCLGRMQGGELFVPKIPSARIVDLATALCPEATFNVTGMRPGEKLHEVLCPVDEAHQTIEFDDHFVIKPAWMFQGKCGYTVNSRGEAGIPVNDSFEYRSDTNTEFLTPSAILQLIESPG